MVNFSDYSVRALAIICAGNFMTSAESRVAQISDGLAPAEAMTSKYTLPPLGYTYDALEPYFDQATMEIHHSKHHQTYVNNLNNLLANVDSSVSTLEVDDLVTKLGEIQESIPAANRTGVRNNAGGHSNHSFFWKQLKVNTTLGGDLEAAIVKDFGNVTEFKTQFETAATKVFGSGWAWLVVQNGALKVVSTPNQDSPLMGKDISGTEGIPIIALDVWEHAYYLKYQNRRPDYIKAYWNVVNWDFAAQRYAEIKSMKY